MRVLEIIRQDNVLPNDLVEGLLTGNLPEDAVQLIQDHLKTHFEPTLFRLAEQELTENQN